jgi:restriction system protein
MAGSRSKKRATWQDRLLITVLGAALLLLTLMWLATSIARAIVGPRDPHAQAVVTWIVLACIGLTALALWRKWRNRRRSRYTRLPELLALTPLQFEEAVGAILQDSGFRKVRRVGGSGDLSADLTAIDSNGNSVVVQCKRLAPGSKIGSPDIQKFLGMAVVHHRAARAFFVTTSEFTRPAVELANAHSLDLWDGAYLSQRLESIHNRRVVKL